MVTAGRPHMPGYGVLATNEGMGLLPWSWAERKLRDSHYYWLSSTWPDGRSHLTPVWGIWLDTAFWFSSGSRSRKVRNLTDRACCSVAIDDPRDPVVLDGVAEILGDEQGRRRFLDALNDKYVVHYGVEFLDGVKNLCLRVRPTSGFGLQQADFVGSATRWTFP